MEKDKAAADAAIERRKADEAAEQAARELELGNSGGR